MLEARPAPRARGPTLLFDLDNTLHDASHAIFGEINRRMTEFVRTELDLDQAAADALRQHYWRRYGATLLGLVRHHRVSAARFLHAAHDFDVAALLRAEGGLVQLMRRLPGRKLLLTNAPAAYAARVLRHLRLHGQLSRRYTIESMRLHGSFRPKPSRAGLRHLLARERVPAQRAVLVDDTPANLKAARAVGLRTVLITHGSRSAARRTARAGYVDVRLRSVTALPRVLRRLSLSSLQP